MRGIVFFLVGMQLHSLAQFDPAGGQIGSISIHHSDPAISSWADSISFHPGWLQINEKAEGKVNTATDLALGEADGRVLSLGDSGYATYHITGGLVNSQGYDFAVFENGFEAQDGYYLELAFVEVSVDGINFIRYPSESVADTTVQLGFASVTKPEFYHNLAGKHQAPFGTLFDLEDVSLDTVYFIRLVDVTGSMIDSVASRDTKGRKINDPWPSPFSSCGFDLDALAFVDGSMVYTPQPELHIAGVYPNPAKAGDRIHIDIEGIVSLTLVDIQGKVQWIDTNKRFTIEQAGVYWLNIQTTDQWLIQRITVY